MDNINNTGIKVVKKLIKVYVSNGLPVLDNSGKIIVKNNVIGDPDYIAPYEDFCDCPTPESEICGPDSIEDCRLNNINFLPIVGTLDEDSYSFVIGVNDTNNLYQFKNPITGNWHDATIGNNKTSYDIPISDYVQIVVRVRRKNCVEEKIKIIDIPPVITPEPIMNTIVVSEYES